MYQYCVCKKERKREKKKKETKIENIETELQKKKANEADEDGEQKWMRNRLIFPSGSNGFSEPPQRGYYNRKHFEHCLQAIAFSHCDTTKCISKETILCKLFTTIFCNIFFHSICGVFVVVDNLLHWSLLGQSFGDVLLSRCLFSFDFSHVNMLLKWL